MCSWLQLKSCRIHIIKTIIYCIWHKIQKWSDHQLLQCIVNNDLSRLFLKDICHVSSNLSCFVFMYVTRDVLFWLLPIFFTMKMSISDPKNPYILISDTYQLYKSFIYIRFIYMIPIPGYLIPILVSVIPNPMEWFLIPITRIFWLPIPTNHINNSYIIS